MNDTEDGVKLFKRLKLVLLSAAIISSYQVGEYVGQLEGQRTTREYAKKIVHNEQREMYNKIEKTEKKFPIEYEYWKNNKNEEKPFFWYAPETKKLQAILDEQKEFSRSLEDIYQRL